MAKVMILSIPEEEESLIDKIMAVVNSTQDEQGTERRKSVSVIHIGTLEINMSVAEKYEGVLTVEKVQQMMADFKPTQDLHGMDTLIE